MLRVLEETDVIQLIDRAQAIETVECAYRDAAAGTATVSHPAALGLRGKTGSGVEFKVKGAVLDRFGVVGLRAIGDGEKLSDGARAYVYLLDASTAAPLGLVAEGALHRVRTAVTGLVTCRALAPADFETIALIGTGRIAEEFVRCVGFVFPGKSILVASRDPVRARDVTARWQKLTQNPLRPASSIKAALAQAQIVVTLTDAAETLFAARDLKSPTLICGMGGRHEFDSDVLVAAAAFVVDEIDFVCTAGSGAHWIKSGQLTREKIAGRVDATIGDVLLGSKRIAAGGIVLAIIQGMAVCDVALAKAVFDRALEA
jgi:ornithine cyclodeaminase/alanine dehydrogenase-like protein (mu-crystallin family)